ncbi:MAG: cytidylate kinase [Deltaproteobacteria bacterium HGW-Deltaproteobacteria-4]|nr:MAG: cytidylate kinase [Deltaproteobacteria bacterium HGW-Deltaproteobacteria-4]
MNELIVAIDGPSGAGKSTLSKLLAKRLDYIHLDTGAMYRCVALAALTQRIDPADQERLGILVQQLKIEFVHTPAGDLVFLDGEDVSVAIRTPQVSLLTSQIAAAPQVREALVALQRRLGASGGVVLEGRDIGTVVFPQAQVKFFLSATAAKRGQRRFDELIAKGVKVSLQQTISDVIARDLADSEREHAPLLQADDALVIDSTNLSIEEVLALMVRVVQKRHQDLR